MHKKVITIAIVVLFFGVGVLSSTGSDIKKIKLEQQSENKWTWLFYDDADFYNAYDPLRDFAKEAYSGENLDVIVLQDTRYGPAKIWYITENHEQEFIEEWGEVDMGASQTLQDFLEYGKTNYPANRYILSMYDHGNAWKGACVDDTNGGWLTMNDMQQAISNTSGVDIICFTAPCLMGALESVYELRDCLDLYVGSEEYSGFILWFTVIEKMCDLFNQQPDTELDIIGEQIINFIDENEHIEGSETFTMSAVKTDFMDSIASELNDLITSIELNFEDSFELVWSIYRTVEKFGSGSFIDFYDFLDEYYQKETNLIIKEKLSNIINLLSATIIAQCHGTKYTGANGLTIYFPDPLRWDYDESYDSFDYGLDFTTDTFWNELLHKYLDVITPEPDQQQTVYDTGSVVCKQISWAQSFKPKYSNLARVELKIFRTGGIQTDFTLELRKEIDGEDLASYSIPYINIPQDYPSWILFDFDDITVTPDDTYYIVCLSNGGNNILDYYVLGGCKDGSLYPDGEKWIKYKQNDWIEYEPPGDACFKTYAYDPEIPAPTISGPSIVKPDKDYEFTFSTTYPGNQEVYYIIDWGDGTGTYWTGPYLPTEEVIIKHKWSNKGSYLIRVQARNISGYVSDWGTMTLTVPRCRSINNIFLNFLEKHPNLFPPMRQILGL